MKRHLYIWQQEGWPGFTWDSSAINKQLTDIYQLRGMLFGKMSMCGFKEKSESALESMTQEIVNSAAIEGERLDHDSVRSSVANHLGIKYAGLPKTDHYTEGVVQIMLDVTTNHATPLDCERLWSWHCALFPTGRSGMYRIEVGNWRQGDEPMQVVSGPIGKQKVHFEAPPSESVPPMMQEFIHWIENEDKIDDIVKAAIAHLWFLTIHPFDDGNGRICRTITELLLSRSDNTSHRFYSVSSQILKHKAEYYNHLEKAQKGSLDITEWVAWFLEIFALAIKTSLEKLEAVERKIVFWDRHRNTPLNARQTKVINMMLNGFDGVLNSSKWYKINHCSQDTAQRDISDLVNKGILRKCDGGGRSTCYEMIW